MDFIQSFRAFLEMETKYNIDNLVNAILDLDCSIERIAHHIPDPEYPLDYGRNVIFRSDLLEAIITNFPRQVETPIHNHGSSVGCVYVVAGTLINKLYTLDSSKPKLYKVEKLKEKEFIYVTRDQIHSTHNINNENLVTLNVYSPPQNNTKIYEKDIKRPKCQ